MRADNRGFHENPSGNSQQSVLDPNIHMRETKAQNILKGLATRQAFNRCCPIAVPILSQISRVSFGSAKQALDPQPSS